MREVQNPFQSARLRDLPWWRGVTFHDDKNDVFDGLTAELESAFARALAGASLHHFRREYGRITRAMVDQLPEEPLLPAIIGHAYRRLVTFYCYRRQRSRSQVQFLHGESSILKWELPHGLLRTAIDQTDSMQQSGVTHQEFDLKSSPALRSWLFDNCWPVVRNFSGMMAAPILYAHIRCLSYDRHGGTYRDRFRFHHFGNHHYDEDVYSLPLIIYLSEVGAECGPFEYLSAADRYTSNPVLRAFHQALNHECAVSPLEPQSFATIARLPAVLRGGDVMGNLYSPTDFEKAGPIAVHGPVGTAIMFDGFNVIHAGGFPSAGTRKSLFVNFRFPIAKLVTRARLALSPAPLS